MGVIGGSLFSDEGIHIRPTRYHFNALAMAAFSILASIFSSLFFIGLLNGLLPCGLVYMAIAGAIGTGAVFSGSLYMIMFGLGTLPMLLGITLAGNLLGLAFRKRINKVIPVLVILVGIFFVLRGLSLGIPFLSPPKEKIEKKFGKSIKVHSRNVNVKSLLRYDIIDELICFDCNLNPEIKVKNSSTGAPINF